MKQTPPNLPCTLAGSNQPQMKVSLYVTSQISDHKLPRFCPTLEKILPEQ